MSISIKSSSPRQSSLDGKFTWEQGQGKLSTNTTAIAVTPSVANEPVDVMAAIEDLPSDGGTIFLRNGTYLVSQDIVLPDYVTLEGESELGVIIDFQNQAYQIRAQGTNPYSEGTLSVDNGSDAVTGTGTSWTVGMIGQSIMIQGIAFVILDVASSTELTLESPFDSPSVTDVLYVIVNPATGMAVRRLSIQNSTHDFGALLFRYVSTGDLEGVSIYDSTIGFNYLDCTYITNEAMTSVGCGIGVNLDHAGGWTFDDLGFFASTTDNMVLNRLISASISNATNSSAGNNGITITNSSNIGIYDQTITTNGANGIEISNSSHLQIFGMGIEENVGDGVKLTDNVDRAILSSLVLSNNGGYGVNIVDSTSAENMLAASVFNNNTSGEYDDNGTDTVILLTTGGGGGLSDGDYGDVTVSSSGTVISVDNDVVTFAKMQNINSDKLLGRDTASSGNVEEIVLDDTLEFDGSQTLQRAALTGNVTAPAGSNTTTIGNAVVTNAMLDTAAGAPGGAWTAWSPTLSGRLNNTKWDKAGAFLQVGKTVHAYLQLTANAATPADGGTAEFIIELPVTSVAMGTQYIAVMGTAQVADAGVTLLAVPVYNTTTTIVVRNLLSSGTNVQPQTMSATNPFTWASTDQIYVNISYQAA